MSNGDVQPGPVFTQPGTPGRPSGQFFPRTFPTGGPSGNIPRILIPAGGFDFAGGVFVPAVRDIGPAANEPEARPRPVPRPPTRGRPGTVIPFPGTTRFRFGGAGAIPAVELASLGIGNVLLEQLFPEFSLRLLELEEEKERLRIAALERVARLTENIRQSLSGRAFTVTGQRLTPVEAPQIEIEPPRLPSPAPEPAPEITFDVPLGTPSADPGMRPGPTPTPEPATFPRPAVPPATSPTPVPRSPATAPVTPPLVRPVPTPRISVLPQLLPSILPSSVPGILPTPLPRELPVPITRVPEIRTPGLPLPPLPVPLTPIQSDPLQSLAQQAQPQAERCQNVKRRRRRKGKCREGFFEERTGETKFVTWRTVDCVTRRPV